MVSNKRSLAGELEDQDEDIYLEDYYEDDEDIYIPPYRHRGRQLRKRDVPYSYEVSDDMIFETLNSKFPLGGLSSFMGKGEELEFRNVKYAGSYQWEGMPLMRDQLGVDQKHYRLPGERKFSTPAVPDILGDPTSVGRLDSDYKNDFIDFVIDAKDASFLRPSFSPFEPLFDSLLPMSNSTTHKPEHALDSIDLIADHTTLLQIILFLQNPPSLYFRTDCQYTHSKGPVVMHRWLAKILYGAGEPHRGHVNSYTRRVTERQMGESWKGETTQIVRYELGGMGMMVRYAVSARLAGDDGLRGEAKIHHTLNTKHTTKTKTKTKTKIKLPTEQCKEIDRSKFVYVKVISQHPYNPEIRKSDLENIYLRLLLTQTTHCLIAPHYKGDFAQPAYPPRMITIDDPILYQVKETMDALVKRAIGVWKNMVLITRHYEKNVSFVGNENGGMTVLGMKQGVYEHVELSQEVLGMLQEAKPYELAKGDINAYKPFVYRKTVGDWARLNQHCDPLVARWDLEPEDW